MTLGGRVAGSDSRKSRAFAAELHTISSGCFAGKVDGAATSFTAGCASGDSEAAIASWSALAVNDNADSGLLSDNSDGEKGSRTLCPASSSLSSDSLLGLCTATERVISCGGDTPPGSAAVKGSWPVCCICHADASLLCMLEGPPSLARGAPQFPQNCSSANSLFPHFQQGDFAAVAGLVPILAPVAAAV